MAKPTQEQIEFLDSLKSWCSSLELKDEINLKMTNEFKSFIQDCRSKNVAHDVLSIIEEEYKNLESSSIGNHPLANRVLHSIAWTIEHCYENTIWGHDLFKLINDPEKAKEYLITKAVNSNSPSLGSYESQAENRLLCRKMNNLIAILDKWICGLEHLHEIPKWKIVPMRNRYARYKKEFEDYQNICSVCILSQYVDNPEEAKLFISEIFTTRQENFYSSLEKWAKELSDNDCGAWITSFLEKGRDLRIKRITVLKMIDSEEKAKAFLMSKYQEKLNWDEHKKEERERKHKSVFDNTNLNLGSLTSVLSPFSAEDTLYSICLSANFFGNDRHILSNEEGYKIDNDCIHKHVSERLTLSSTNMLCYRYRSTYMKNTKSFIFYTPKACAIILDYLRKYTDISAYKDIVGIVTYEGDYGKTYTYIITNNKELYSNAPIIKYNQEPKKRIPGRIYNLSEERLFEQSLISFILKDNELIPNKPGINISDRSKKKIKDYISENYSNFSFEQKYACKVLFPKSYEFPYDETCTETNYGNFYRAAIDNMFSCLTYHYNTPLFDDRYLEYAKIKFQYGDSTFSKLTDNICKGMFQESRRLNWINWLSKPDIKAYRVLLYINWVFISNKSNKVKKITALWLYHYIYKQYKQSYPKDECFWNILLSYVLIENEPIFNHLLKKLDYKVDNISICVHDLVSKLIKYQNDRSKQLTYEQKDYLSKNIKKDSFFTDYMRKHVNHQINRDPKILNIFEDLDLYLKPLIECEDYNSDRLLVKINDLPQLPIPNNFYYRGNGNHYSSYDYGDYSGSYAHDVMGYSNSDIDTIFDGDPDAYWNID